MKKLVLTLMFLMAVVLSGCDNTEGDADAKPADATTEETTEDAGAAETEDGDDDSK